MFLDIERLKKSRSWLRCKRAPHLAYYMINLWTAAWHEVPAGSLEDDEDILADRAGCTSLKQWATVRDDVMHGWILCSDGRYYHPVVSEKAMEAWGKRQGWRDRTAKAREERARRRSESRNAAAQQRNENLDQKSEQPPPLENSTTSPEKSSVTDNVTAVKGEGEGEVQVPLRGTCGDAKPIDIKKAAWDAGMAFVRGHMKWTEARARAFIGRLFKTAKQDAAIVLAAFRRASENPPAEPQSWLVAAVKPNTSATADMREAWGLTSFIDPALRHD